MLVREFDNLCSDVSLVAMDVPRKMAWILIQVDKCSILAVDKSLGVGNLM